MLWFGDHYKLGHYQQIKHKFIFGFTVLSRVTSLFLNPSCKPLSSKIGGIIVVVFRNHWTFTVCCSEITFNWNRTTLAKLRSWRKYSIFHSLPQTTTAFRIYWFCHIKHDMWCQGPDWELVAWIIYHLDERACLQQYGEKEPCELSPSPWKGEHGLFKGLWRVRNCTQQAGNVSLIPSLPEDVGSSMDAGVTWAELQVLVLREGRGLCRAGLSQERGSPGDPALPLVQPCQALGAGCCCRQGKAAGEPLGSRMDLSGTEDLLTQTLTHGLFCKMNQENCRCFQFCGNKNLVPHRTWPAQMVFHRAAQILWFLRGFWLAHFNGFVMYKLTIPVSLSLTQNPQYSASFHHSSLFLKVRTERMNQASENAQQLTYILNKPASWHLVWQVEEEIGSW